MRWKEYLKFSCWSDFQAALTVSVVLIPQAMAYALLAGLPPEYGLYAAMIPMLVYPFIGTSSYLSVGPVAIISIILYSGLTTIAEPGSEKYIELVLLTGVLAGLFQVGFGFLKLGFISNFLSRSVLSGFISAAGVIIVVSQFKYLLGIDLPRQDSIGGSLWVLLSHLELINPWAFGLGIGALTILLIFRRFKKIPSAILVVTFGGVLVYSFGLEEQGVETISVAANSLPHFTYSFINLRDLDKVFPTALVLSLICFIGSIAIARKLEDSEVISKVDANRELLGLGFAKVIGSLFMSIPTTGSFTRSVISKESGAHTKMTGVFTGMITIAVVGLFSPLLDYLPVSVLAGLVIMTGILLIDYKYPQFLYKVDRSDFWVLIATFLITLMIGIVNGVIMGVTLSLITVLAKDAKAELVELGELEGTSEYRNIRRFKAAMTLPECLIVRYSQPLFFANADAFLHQFLEKINSTENLKFIVFSFTSYQVPDGTATERLFDLKKQAEKHRVTLILTDVTGPVRDYFQRVGLTEVIGSQNFFLSIADAIRAIRHGFDPDSLSNKYSKQSYGPNL